MALSKIRTNYHSSSEALINKQINMELHASYVYMSMVSTSKLIHEYFSSNSYIFFFFLMIYESSLHCFN